MFKLNYISIFYIGIVTTTVLGMEKEQPVILKAQRGNARQRQVFVEAVKKLAEKCKQIEILEEDIERGERKLKKKREMSNLIKKERHSQNKKRKASVINLEQIPESQSSKIEPDPTKQIANQILKSLKPVYEDIRKESEDELNNFVNEDDRLSNNSNDSASGVEGSYQIDTTEESVSPLAVTLLGGIVVCIIYKLYKFCFDDNRSNRWQENHPEFSKF